jgi:hypothetical protein
VKLLTQRIDSLFIACPGEIRTRSKRANRGLNIVRRKHLVKQLSDELVTGISDYSSGSGRSHPQQD